MDFFIGIETYKIPKKVISILLKRRNESGGAATEPGLCLLC